MSALATLLIAALSKDHTDAVDVLERRSAFQMHFFYSPCFQSCCRRFKSRAALVGVRDGERGMGEEKMEGAIAFGSLAHRCVIQPIQRYRTRNSDRPSC